MIVAITMRVAPLVAGLWLALAGTAVAEVSQGKPAVPQAKPAVSPARPAVPQGKPAVAQGKPTVPQGKPPVLPGKQAKPPKLTHPMKVVIVRDSRTGCEPDCAEWISAEGQIAPGTPAEFRRVFKVLGKKKLPIFIASGGGNVQAAYAIGRDIRKRGLDVAVEWTIFEKCEAASAPCDRRALKDGDKGRPEPIAAPCVSSCVFILAAGTERVVPVYGFVGVHQLTAFQTQRLVRRTYQVQRKFQNWRIVETRQLVAEQQISSTTVEADPNYGAARAYFTEMGIDTAKIMPLVLGTPHQDVHRMTPEERRATRLVTRVAAGHALLPGAATAGAGSAGAVTADATPAGAAMAGAVTADAAPAGAAPAGAASRPTETAASAAPAVPVTPPAVTGAGAPAITTVKTLPVTAQNAAALANVSAGLVVLHTPPDDVLELFVRLKSTSGAPVHPAQYAAEIQLSNGKKLTAGSTGEDMADPLYATLAREEFCALRGADGLPLKVALTHTALPGWPRSMLFKITKINGDTEFAAKHCGKKEEAAKPPPRS